jgi:hypothetical protein
VTDRIHTEAARHMHCGATSPRSAKGAGPERGQDRGSAMANKLRRKRELRTDAAYLRECFGVDAENFLVRLTRPIEHFTAFANPRQAQAEYNNRFAGKPAGSTEKIGKAGARQRVNLDGHLIYLNLVFDALGTTTGLRAATISARIERLDTEVERLREAIDWINSEAEEIRTEIAGIDLQTIADAIDLEPPDIPEAELPDQPDDGPNMVLSSSWDWVEATERMKARKAYEEGDGDDADDDDSEEEESDE